MLEYLPLVIGIVLIIFVVLIMLWLKKGGLWDILMFKLKGGSMVIRVFLDQGLDFSFSKQPVQEVYFRAKDRKTGEEKKLITNITSTKHYFRGTGKPIHICLFSRDENLDLWKQTKPDKSAELINQFGIISYETGLRDGMAIKDEFGMLPNWLQGKVHWLLILIILLIGLMLALNYVTLDTIWTKGV